MKHMVHILETWSSQHWSLSTVELEGDTGKSNFSCPEWEIAADNERSNDSVDYLACWLAADCKCCSDPINNPFFQCHFLIPLSLHALQLYLHFYNTVFVGARVTHCTNLCSSFFWHSRLARIWYERRAYGFSTKVLPRESFLKWESTIQLSFFNYPCSCTYLL